MRKAKVLKGRASGRWLVTQPDGLGFLDVDTHAEAMFLAQLLADPHEYLRESQAAVWDECAEEYCDYQWNSAGGTLFDPPRNPYWKDKINDNDNS